ncbi:MAG: hypothetical protein RLZZ293_615 [Pseudomonadota bacterium]|jgi:hypothetical protein
MGKISDVAVGRVMTDYWKAYNEFVPHEKHKLIQLRDIIAYLDIFYLGYDVELNVIVSLKKCYYYQ